MKILQVTEAQLGGLGRHVLDLTEGLILRGHFVHLVYSPTAGRTDERFSRRVNTLAKHPNLHISTRPMRRHVHPSDLGAVLYLCKLIRRAGPFDLVHAHSTKAGIVARLAAFVSGVPGIYTPNAFPSMNPDLTGSWRLGAVTLERLLGRAGKALIAVSREEFNHAGAIGIPRNKLFLIPNGVPVDHHVCRDQDVRKFIRGKFSIGSEQVCVGFVGRLCHQKDPVFLLRAFSEIPESARSNAVLLLVGDGPLRDEVENAIRKMNLSQYVRLTGDADGMAMMNAFDVLALSSRYEGFPYVVLEALSRCLPVVATRVAGMTSLIHENENGVSLSWGDSKGFASALSMLIADSERRARFGSYGRQVVNEFSVEQMLEKTIAVYSACISFAHTRDLKAD